MLQLLDGVEYLHSVNVIHRDLKLGNIFLTDGLNVRIGDFGLAARLEHKEEKKKTMCGTPNYLAPEILDGTLGHSFEVDIWSLGVILYTLLVGKPPFETKNVKQTYKRIQANLYVFPREIPLSAEAVDLVRIILNKDPKMRPSLKAIRAHPFFTCVHPPAERRRDDIASPSTRTFADKENAAASGNHGARPRASPKIKSRHQLERERAAERGQWLRQSQNPQHPQQADVRRLVAASPKVPSPSPRSSRRSSEASPMSLASPTTPKVPARSPAEGAPLVVQKWVDYTSKYGLGYLLQGGLVGVYFNDATKLIVAPNRYEFQYYERGAQDFARHTLTRYPKELHKKVTLVKHFRNYLEKEPSGDPEATEAAAATMAAAEAMAASAGGRSPVSPEHFEDASVPLPFVKKWVRTRHAIFFRLSNRTVQVAFFDDTQILLSAQAKRLTYFDKSRQAQTLPIEEAKMDAEISKRLRYTKDVLHKLIAGSSPSPTR
ncbi:Serine/threonine-protein kinase PLK1 [Hondaea fermentalgiana]|uniref:Serine/threonine-protein kinase PLK1 n=1 Tax=Hondaea fermentalgiana TaxID=2315210 RepID=A0A2R5GJV3_9STRA|nr:Serine/threonine-protein kinase PLK1 [Hondaea fermentalgiana]|eukprot:GBG31172.1 Serine/threonine-protein kinase PLK1 [Hondaea fermentalgiana]